MKTIASCLMVACCVGSTTSAYADGAATPEAALHAYFDGEFHFEVAKLEAVLAKDFVEISPIGDIDTREQVLGFYAPEHKVPLPAVALSAIDVRRNGEQAFATATARYELGGKPRTLVFGISLSHDGQGWMLHSAQTTPKPGKAQAGRQAAIGSKSTSRCDACSGKLR